ncbi:YceD family protein [Thermaurantiacus sp.]
MTETVPEFSHGLMVDRIAANGMVLYLEAGADSRLQLAARFGLVALDRLEADLVVTRDARGVTLAGRFAADVIQACVISGEPVQARIAEELALRFEELAEPVPDCEVELSHEALDLLPIEDGAIDVGEALAQSLALALDPYPRAGPEVLAKARRQFANAQKLAERCQPSPFAILRQQ